MGSELSSLFSTKTSHFLPGVGFPLNKRGHWAILRPVLSRGCCPESPPFPLAGLQLRAQLLLPTPCALPSGRHRPAGEPPAWGPPALSLRVSLHQTRALRHRPRLSCSWLCPSPGACEHSINTSGFKGWAVFTVALGGICPFDA